MKGEILCEEETLGGEFSLLFSVLFLLVNKIFYFLSHFNSWFLTHLKGQSKLSKRHARWVELLEKFQYVIKHKKGNPM